MEKASMRFMGAKNFMIKSDDCRKNLWFLKEIQI